MILTSDIKVGRRPHPGLNFCFSCGEPLEDRSIILLDGWDKFQHHLIASVALHATCASKLATALGSEALEAAGKNA